MAQEQFDTQNNNVITAEGIKIVTMVISENGKYQRTVIIVLKGNVLYVYQVEMVIETVCLVRPIQYGESRNKVFDLIEDFIHKNFRSGKTCGVSVEGIDNAADLCIQAHTIIGPYDMEPFYVHVRYDFNVQIKETILKRLCEAPSTCFYMDIPRSCAVAYAPMAA